MNKIRVFIEVLIGNALLAFGVVAFALPAKIIVGGVTGVSLVISALTKINYTYFVYFLNIGLFLLGTLYFGKKFALGTLVSTIFYPAFIILFEAIPQIKMLSSDMLLCCIYAGVCMGVGMGIVFRLGFSTGGMDVPPLILAEKTGYNVTFFINLIDIMILLSQIPFNKTEGILYGIITVVVTNYAIDRTLMLGTKNFQVFIISPEFEKIKESIFRDINRGCTLVNITTGYLKKEQSAVMCVVSRRELKTLNDLVLSIDSEAFLITSEIHNVNGRGFTLPEIDL